MNMLAPISLNNYNQVYPPKTPNIAFGSTQRGYMMDDKKGISCYTVFFRGDLSWKNFAKYADSNFKHKKKVNVINGACSDGTESYSLAIAIRENLSLKRQDKFLPIHAYDYDKEIIKAANSGLILMSGSDLISIKLNIPNEYKYFEETDEVLDINGDNTAHFKYTKKVKDNLRKDVIFEQKDIFDVLENLEDDSNSIVMFRNAIGHLGDEFAFNFAKLASEKLKSGSLVVIGGLDRSKTDIVEYLEERGFTEVMSNVFRKNEEKTSFIEKIKNFFK